jgi:23S rRNA A2030 N6-methylase RlmJ
MKGMYGSGLAIINPPWGLKEQLQEALTFLCSIGETQKRQFTLEVIDVNQGSSKR